MRHTSLILGFFKMSNLAVLFTDSQKQICEKELSQIEIFFNERNFQTLSLSDTKKTFYLGDFKSSEKSVSSEKDLSEYCSNYKNVFFISSFTTSFSAIRISLTNEVRKVISFSPLTDFRARTIKSDTRKEKFYSKIVECEKTDRKRDLNYFLKRKKKSSTKYDIFYPCYSDYHRKQAINIGDYSSVNLHGIWSLSHVFSDIKFPFFKVLANAVRS